MGAARLVFLHGFTQTHHHWHGPADALRRRLGGKCTLAFVDLPGHGLSGDARGIAIDDRRALVAAGGAGVYVGYSMGARWALNAAAFHASEIERMVLIGGSPGLADAAERTRRVEADNALADRIAARGVSDFVDEWMAAPMFAGLPDNPDDRRHRRANTAAGLASSLALAGTGAQPSLWDALPTIEIPTLLVTGADDAKFTAIAEKMVTTMPCADHVRIAHAGHAAHLEQPVATAAAVADWLRH